MEMLSMQHMSFKEQHDNMVKILDALYRDKVAKDALFKKAQDLIKGTKGLLDKLKQKKIMALIEIILSSISEDENTEVVQSSGTAEMKEEAMLSSSEVKLTDDASIEPGPDQSPGELKDVVGDHHAHDEDDYGEDQFEEH